MNVLDLPVEVGAIIFSYLDLKTRINVYNSSRSLREYFGTWFHIKTVNLSRSTLATVDTLYENLFSDFGDHIKELDLSGLVDLTVDNLKPFMKRFVNLSRLDVTFTQINLQDIPEICPSNLRKIGINFFKTPLFYLNTIIFNNCRHFFRHKHFEAIHFVVGHWEDLDVVFSVLQNTYTGHLKLTISGPTDDDDEGQYYDITHTRYYYNSNNFNKLTVIFGVYPGFVTQNVSSALNFIQLEYILITYSNKIVVYVSPILSKIVSVSHTNLTVVVTPYLSRDLKLGGNIHFKAWNKATTKFEDDFFSNLLKELKDFFPKYVCNHCREPLNVVDCSNKWCCIDGYGPGFQKNLESAPEKLTLSSYCRSSGRQVACRAVRIPHQTKGLENLTLLHINRIPIKKDFFRVLFAESPKLTTLVIYTLLDHDVKRYLLGLSRAIHLAKLKNFMMIASKIAFDTTFEILSRCPSLENVHIREAEPVREYNYFGYRFYHSKPRDCKNIELFIEKSINLCSLLIETGISAEDLTLLLSCLKYTADSLGRKHLWIDVCDTCYSYPFMDVFNPSPLLIMD